MVKEKGYTRANSLIGIAPLVLFLSSYMPLFLIIAFRQILKNSTYLNWGGWNMDAISLFIKCFGLSIVCVCLIILGLWGTYHVFKNLDLRIENGNTFQVIEVSSMNDEPLAYVATYIIPIIFENYSSGTDLLTIVFLFYIIYRLYIRSKLILVNPFLSLKYTIFNIKYKDGKIIRQGILISKDNCILEGDSAKIYNIGYQLFYGYKRL